MKIGVLLLAVFLCTAALMGCGSDRRDEPFTEPLSATRDPNVLGGERVFMSTCQQCHPWGSAGYGPSLNAQGLPGWYIDFRVRNGGVGMPPFGNDRISDAQLGDVVAYVQALHDLQPAQ